MEQWVVLQGKLQLGPTKSSQTSLKMTSSLQTECPQSTDESFIFFEVGLLNVKRIGVAIGLGLERMVVVVGRMVGEAFSCTWKLHII